MPPARRAGTRSTAAATKVRGEQGRDLREVLDSAPHCRAALRFHARSGVAGRGERARAHDSEKDGEEGEGDGLFDRAIAIDRPTINPRTFSLHSPPAPPAAATQTTPTVT